VTAQTLFGQCLCRVKTVQKYGFFQGRCRGDILGEGHALLVYGSSRAASSRPPIAMPPITTRMPYPPDTRPAWPLTAAALAIPAIALLFLPVIVGMSWIYPWVWEQFLRARDIANGDW
jgi:hypothetical protein